MTEVERNQGKSLHRTHCNSKEFATITFICKERKGKAKSTFLEQSQPWAATQALNITSGTLERRDKSRIAER